MMSKPSKKSGDDAPSSPKKSKTTSTPSTSNPTPTFKGSGLGAGPKHTNDPKDQPWVEK